jgi:hypothetical protein
MIKREDTDFFLQVFQHFTGLKGLPSSERSIAAERVLCRSTSEEVQVPKSKRL